MYKFTDKLEKQLQKLQSNIQSFRKDLSILRNGHKHPFLSPQRCVDRLVEDYLKHKNLIIAFDFDNTIYDYHKTGEDFSEVIDLLKECSDFGLTLILYTAQEKQSEIDWRIKYCEDLGIKVNYVNESPVMNQSKKPYYNILLDDRAGLDSTFYQLFDALQMIKKF